MSDRREIPPFGRILAIDGHVGFIAGCGIGFGAWIALMLAIRPPMSGWWHLAAVSTPFLVLWPAALLWAVAIRSTFQSGAEAQGRITSRHTGWRGLVVIKFSYSLHGAERTASNQFMPTSKAGRLQPGAPVTVVVSRAFPGPLIKEVYSL